MLNSTNRIRKRLNLLAETDISPGSDLQILRSLLDFSKSITPDMLAGFTPQNRDRISRQPPDTDHPLQIHTIVGCDISLITQTILPHQGDELFILAPSLGSAMLMLDNFDLNAVFNPMRVHLFISPENFISSVKKEQNFWRKVNLWLTPTAKNNQPELCDKITEQIKICNKVAASETRTLNQHYFSWAENENSNLNRLVDHPHSRTSELRHLSTVPALLIGAGPSLKSAIPFLKKLKKNNQTLLIAASTVLRVLEKEDVLPHFTIILEGHLQQAHFTPLSESYIKQLTLLAALQTHPAHLKFPFKEIYWFHHQTSATEKLVRQLLPEAVPIHTSGGSVINDGVRLALDWGCNPVALCGCDMAYSPDNKYLAGLEKKESYQEEKSKEYFPVPGQKDETLFAPAEFISYVQGLENMITAFKKEARELEVYNLSVGGRRLPGTIEISPEKFYELTLTKTPNLNDKIEQLTNSWIKPQKENLTRLQEHREILAELSRTLQTVLKDKGNGNILTQTAQISTARYLLDQLPEFTNGAAQIMIPWMRRLLSGEMETADLNKLLTSVKRLHLKAQPKSSVHTRRIQDREPAHCGDEHQ